jgi:hypothetical protein
MDYSVPIFKDNNVNKEREDVEENFPKPRDRGRPPKHKVREDNTPNQNFEILKYLT